MPWEPSEPGERPTLGWAVLDWVEEHLIVPDGPSQGDPLTFTNEQARFILALYEVDPLFDGPPIRGRALVNARLVRRAVLSRPKGWGKSPICAALCIAEALGPVVLDGWDADGQPVGREWVSLGFKPKVQVVAASEDQTTNTWDPLLEMCRNGPVYDAYDIEPMETFVNVPGGVIEPTTSSGRSREGYRPVFAGLDQTESWDRSNGGHRLAAAVRRNLGKMQGCSLETPNAPRPGMDTVAERSFAAWDLQQQGRLKRSTGMLVDHREAPPDTDPSDEASLRAGLRVAYGESLDTNGGWVAEDRIVSEYYDPDTDPSDAAAYYLNQVTAAAGSWVTKQEWLSNADEGLHLDDDDTIALAFDGSKSDDATGLVACRIGDGASFVIGEWRRPEGEAGRGWEVDRADVDRVVRSTIETYDVVAFFADVREFESYVDTWGNDFRDGLLIEATSGKYAHPVAWDMRAHVPEFTRATGRALVDIEAGECPHDGDLRLQWHVLNAVRAPNRWGVSIAKRGARDDSPSKDSPFKIDLAVCMILARHARRLVLASETWQKRQTRKQPGRVVGWR